MSYDQCLLGTNLVCNFGGNLRLRQRIFVVILFQTDGAETDPISGFKELFPRDSRIFKTSAKQILRISEATLLKGENPFGRPDFALFAWFATGPTA